MNLTDSPSPSWFADLQLAFGFREGRTAMIRNKHEGPLVVQKALYPEGPELCQILIVHPPGGIAGGDELRVSCDLDVGARVQLTTPGATKWYESFGSPSKQFITLNLAAESICEWLPQENIIFNRCLVDVVTEVNVESGAIFVGWDFYSLGRHVKHAPLLHGQLKQKTKILIDGIPIFTERTLFDPDRLMDGPGILDGYSNYGTMFIVGLDQNPALIEDLRKIAEGEMHCALTWMDGVLIARWVGADIEAGRDIFTAIWARLRPVYFLRSAVKPRIWNT